MSIELIIDDRERKILPYFEKVTDIKITRKRITVGDYCVIIDGKIVIIIERKTNTDLASSLCDGRKNNVEKLLELRDNTKCIILYLIEGSARFNPTKKIGRIPFSSLQAHIDHLIIRDNIHFIYSQNEKDTACRILEFIKNYTKVNKFINNPIKGGHPDESHHLVKQRVISDQEIIHNIWNCIPQITTKY